jgi:Uma2 family endonuclease
MTQPKLASAARKTLYRPRRMSAEAAGGVPSTVFSAGGVIAIPKRLTSLEAFRKWYYSGHFPESGRLGWLCGKLWVDMSPEQLFTHNHLKTVIVSALERLVAAENLGYMFGDGVLLTNRKADISTEPDGMFVSYKALQSRRVRRVKAKTGGYLELRGAPELVLEVVSNSSVGKDTEILREGYWRAAIEEYWLVDARGSAPVFEILRNTTRGYVAARRREGWQKSNLFGRSFRLVEDRSPSGDPRYTLEVR